MSTWWGDSKNMEEIEFSRWLFEGRPRQGKNVLPDGLNWLCYFAGSSKSHRENSISCIFLESPHQVDMKNVFKCFGHIVTYHCEFLEYWNTQKSVWRIWQRFSCLLDEGIPKIWKKLNSHDGFLSYLLNSTANSAHLAAHFCPALVCPQKATVRIQFLPYFWNPLIK